MQTQEVLRLWNSLSPTFSKPQQWFVCLGPTPCIDSPDPSKLPLQSLKKRSLLLGSFFLNSYGSFRKLGVLCWGPYTKEPTIQGTILGFVIFGNSHIPICPKTHHCYYSRICSRGFFQTHEPTVPVTMKSKRKTKAGATYRSH